MTGSPLVLLDLTNQLMAPHFIKARTLLAVLRRPVWRKRRKWLRHQYAVDESGLDRSSDDFVEQFNVLQRVCAS